MPITSPKVTQLLGESGEVAAERWWQMLGSGVLERKLPELAATRWAECRKLSGSFRCVVKDMWERRDKAPPSWPRSHLPITSWNVVAWLLSDNLLKELPCQLGEADVGRGPRPELRGRAGRSKAGLGAVASDVLDASSSSNALSKKSPF